MHFKAAKQIFLLSCCLAFMCSCGTDRMLMSAYKKSPIYDSIAPVLDLNHTYKNKIPGKAITLLPELLYASHLPLKYPYMHDSAGITLNYDGNNRLNIHYASADTVADFSLKVKNKGNYLVLKSHLVVVPIPLLSFYDEQKQILFTVKHGQLVSIFYWKRIVWVLVFFNNKYTGCHHFSRF